MSPGLEKKKTAVPVTTATIDAPWAASSKRHPKHTQYWDTNKAVLKPLLRPAFHKTKNNQTFGSPRRDHTRAPYGIYIYLEFLPGASS